MVAFFLTFRQKKLILTQIYIKKDIMTNITIHAAPQNLHMNPRQAEINENTLVVKENILINTPVDYSEHEQKIIALVVSQIKDNDEEFVPITFTVEQIANQLGISKNKLYTELDSLTNTINRPLIFPFFRDNEIGFDKMPFFSLINYYNGKITFHINDKLKFVLLGLQKSAGQKLEKGHIISYSKYKIRYHTKLKGKHVLRFHELLAQHIYKKIFTTSIDELKKFLHLGGKFQEYKDFKRRVLIPAHEEINKKTNLYFSYEPQKTGKKITHIQFSIFEKGQDHAIIKIKNDLEFYGFSPETITYIFDTLKINFETIKKNIEYCQKLLEKGKIHKIDSYLYTAIIKDYARKTPLELEIEKKIEEDKQKQLIQNIFLMEIKGHKKEFNEILNLQYQNIISKYDKKYIIDDFLKNCPVNFIVEMVKKHLKDKKITYDELFTKLPFRASLKKYLFDKEKVNTNFISYLSIKGITITENFLFENGL
jgi:plasmid replication initiation protein